jgi:intein/homing endonuclease
LDTNFTNDTSQEVWHDTYKYHEDSDINATLQRVAKAVASAENPEKREEVEADFNEILENFAFCPGGRILANAGTEFTGTSMMNCFVGPKPEHDQDSIEGILEVLKTQSLTLKSEGGWGMNFSFIRPRGTFIHGVGIETPGAVKMMELFDTSSQVITEGSGTKSKTKKAKNKIRKGAMMAMLFCWHPDIEEFVTAKQSPGKLTKFNISVACTNEFMDLIVKIDELRKKGASQDEIDRIDTWDLVFPDTTHPEYKKAWTGNIVHWKEQGFPVIVHKTIKASALWDLISKSTYNRNEPGIYFVDIANKTHLLNYIKECDIQATNPCFSGETYIAVADGRSYVTIKELAEEGKDVPVYSYNIESGEVEIQYGRAPRVTGKDQKLLRITLDNGSFIDVTPEHKFVTMDGRELKAFQLSKGDSLPRFIRAKEPVEKGGKDYYRIRTSTIDSSKRIFEHRLIAQFNDPAKWNSLYDANKKSGWVTGGIVVHHKDHNGLNNTPDNLEIMSWGAHTALHSSLSYPGSSNPMYGKQHSAETKEKIGLKTKLRCQEPEYKEKLRKSIKDSVTEETKAKISQRRTEYELNRRIDEAIKTGLTPILVDDELYVEKACEVTGKLFRVPWIHRTRSYGYDISPMQVQHIKEKALASSKAMYAEQAKHNLHLQVMAFKDLQQELGRTPLRKEFEKYCREKKLPFRPNSKTNNEFIPKSWPDFLKVAAEYNHRVVSVKELPGLHTVYNITVDKNHYH